MFMRKNKLLKIFIVTVLLINIELCVIAATTGVANSDTVRVRQKPTTNSEIVELVSIGDKVTITGEEGNWYQVKVGKVTGYIRKDLLTVDKNTSTTTPNEPNVTTTENPNQVEKPNNNTSTPQGGETPSNNSAENPNENINVAFEPNDKTISILKVGAKPSVGQKINLIEETKIKILPSANSSNIAKLQANTEVTVLETMNSWCRIESGENIGWVRIDQ